MRNFIILFCLVVGFDSFAQEQKTMNRVGYANVAYIQSQLPETKEVEAQLSETRTKLREQLTAKSEELKKMYAAYSANDQPDSVQAKLQQQLQQGKAAYDQMQQDAQGTMENSQKLLMAQIYLMVGRAIDDVAKENGYAVILTEQVSGYNLLLYRDEKVDISDLVLKKLGVAPKPAEKIPAPVTKNATKKKS
jgi:outer membrane protein